VTTTRYAVQDVYYSVHTKRGASADAPKSMRVDYRVGWHEYRAEKGTLLILTAYPPKSMMSPFLPRTNDALPLSPHLSNGVSQK
jgi:hypothetical protein